MAETEATSRRRGPYPKGIKRRQEILDRAVDVINERGFEGTSLRAIAESLGVTHAALLHYFNSREELLLEVLRERDARAQPLSGDDYFPGLIRTAEYNTTIPGLIALYTSMLGTSVEPQNEKARAFFTERFENGRSDIRKLLEAGSTEPVTVDPEKLAALTIAAFDGLQIQWLLDPKVDIAGTLELLRVFMPGGAPGSDQPSGDQTS